MIGVGITTRNRPDVLGRALAAWRAFLPAGAVLVVVDDASDSPCDATFRFDVNVGVARAKNKCIEILYAQGVTELFLADDDCWPTVPDWWVPYVNSPMPHLRYSWGGTVRESRDGWVATNRYHGCLMYAHRSVIDRVGGMRPEFTGYGWEHVEWMRRIHNAGLTPHRYIDVVDSDRFWVSLDREARAGRTTHHSTVGDDRYSVAAANRPLLDRFAGTTDYVEFKDAA